MSAAAQLDLLDLLAAGAAKALPDLPGVIAARIFAGHARRWALLRHQRADLSRSELLTQTVGEHSGGSGRVDGLYLSWTASRSGVDVDWREEHYGSLTPVRLRWAPVVAAALDGLTPSEAAELDAAEAVRHDAHAAGAAKFARLALEEQDGTPVLWVAPHDTSGGLPTGSAMPGARCWLCGDIEPNRYLLNLNHGLAAEYPESLDRTTCAVQDRAQRRARHDTAPPVVETRGSLARFLGPFSSG